MWIFIIAIFISLFFLAYRIDELRLRISTITKSSLHKKKTALKEENEVLKRRVKKLEDDFYALEINMARNLVVKI